NDRENVPLHFSPGPDFRPKNPIFSIGASPKTPLHCSSWALEQQLAGRMLRARALRVVFHLEQPRKHSKLFPRVADPANIQQKLRSMLKPVDARPRVVETAHMQDLPWQVR
ncbi:MAG: hypothetical protein H7841_15775, partial [Magnetospirillum sp. WYHS-4]